MKKRVVPVKNVTRTETLFHNLNSRSQVVPGIGLVYGLTGFGKTTTMTWLFNQDGVNAIYIRCYATDTPSSVLERIVRELGMVPRYPMQRMVDDVIERMRAEELTLFVDECDYVVGSNRIMDSFRDIYDGTDQPVILIGMDQIAKRISQRKQLFNRISDWIEFQPADLADVGMFADHLLEADILLEEDLLNAICKRAHGEVRRILTALEKVESLAMANDMAVVSLADLKGREADLFLDFNGKGRLG